jgi:osmotically inducible lipoprotein OsmB
MKRLTLAACLALSALTLAACGNTTGDRALSGGGIGAGVGALGGLMVGAPLEGALIGGAVGAGTGALTNDHQVDLGRPIWK